MGDLTLEFSELAHNTAGGPSSFEAQGGGAVVLGNFHSQSSTISENTATVIAGISDRFSAAGGIAVHSNNGGTNTISRSTFSGNHADVDGAIYLASSVAPTSIQSSTISGNTATLGVAALLSRSPLTLANSTITANVSSAFNTPFAGTSAVFLSDAELELRSSIIAGNESLATVSAGDIDGYGAAAIFGDGDSLVTSSTLPLPRGTKTDCPRLGPLADNGGATLTHAPLHASPAIDAGSADATIIVDQRGASRLFGSAVDIGAVEWEGDDDDRLLASAFEPVCD